jgi:hypothetical protein
VHHGHRIPLEPRAQHLAAARVQFHGEDSGSRLDQRACQGTVACTDVDDKVTGENPSRRHHAGSGPVTQPVPAPPQRIGLRPRVPTMRAPAPAPGHGAP